ncbi:hypothetical protein [Mesorhizobium sp. WSM3868]|uniref:hypothetical protein n=1 Tax=Mesorhizobium sp. WSM3868 TaxID=2029405 RepID=UPI000BAFD016|nr:hypothetical protein [Mesorhizobium sp. WSM3868]PBB32057.1 hypothetical protein CK221_25680 [Mesorhizobium sp. WSM3868]
MAILFPNSDVLLSAAEVQKRVRDRREWQAQIAVLQKQVVETEEWLNHVAKVIGPERANQLIGDVLLPTQVSTSNEAILPSEQHPRRSPIGDEIKRFLKTQTNGATRRQIIGHLLQIQQFQKVVERNNTSVDNVLSRLVKRDELRKIGTIYNSPEASPDENSGFKEATAVPSESSASSPSSPAGHDGASTPTEVSNAQHASGGGPLTSTAYVGLDPAAVPPDGPPNNSLNPATPSEAPPKTQTPRIDFGGPRELPPPTKSLFLPPES